MLRFYSSVCCIIHSIFPPLDFSAGNESCPQPQTSEHLAAIEIMKLKHVLILQNKIDLVKEAQALEQHEQILKFVQGMINSSRVQELQSLDSTLTMQYAQFIA